MRQFSSLRSDYIYKTRKTTVRRLGLILVCAALLVSMTTVALAQDAYPGPATNGEAAPTVVIESYPGADAPVPALIGDPANPTAYPNPGQATTGAAVPSDAGQSGVATPVPLPSVPVESGSQVSLLLVGLVLLGLVGVVGVILARRRK